MGYIPIKTGRVADSTTSLKSILPIGATIYDVDAKKTYKLTANNVAADTITTLLAANKIVEVGGSTGVGAVTSFNTRTGAVVPAAGDYTKAQVGLGNVDNTADTAKPISTAQQTALDLKAPIASPTFTGTVSGITKAMVDLTDVDDTSDADKPVSTAQQTALDLKVAKAGDTMTGNLIINTAGPNNFNLTSPTGKSIAMGIEGSGAEFSIVGSSTTPYTITSYDSSSTIQSALAFKTNGNLGLTNPAGAVTPLADEDLANKKYVDDNSGAITPGTAIPDLPALSATPTKTEFDNIISKINTTLAALRTAGIIAT